MQLFREIILLIYNEIMKTNLIINNQRTVNKINKAIVTKSNHFVNSQTRTYLQEDFLYREKGNKLQLEPRKKKNKQSMKTKRYEDCYDEFNEQAIDNGYKLKDLLAHILYFSLFTYAFVEVPEFNSFGKSLIQFIF